MGLLNFWLISIGCTGPDWTGGRSAGWVLLFLGAGWLAYGTVGGLVGWVLVTSYHKPLSPWTGAFTALRIRFSKQARNLFPSGVTAIEVQTVPSSEQARRLDIKNSRGKRDASTRQWRSQREREVDAKGGNGMG